MHRNLLFEKMKRFLFLFSLIISGPVFFSAQPEVFAAAYPYRILQSESAIRPLMPVVGFIDSHQVKNGQTLLEIARKYGLGYNQVVLYHPDIDPWMPREGKKIDIPTQWILPPTQHEEVVINIPEMRLYRFFRNEKIVRTYPIGIGREGFDTPAGESRVRERIENPSWTVPPNAIEKHGRGVVPPGPDNPLGQYWVGLSKSHLGIHGTNFPWGVGRRVSHGCIRLYPEHIEQFYGETQSGTKVEIIYEPVKVGVRGSFVFLEVHPDIYGRIPDMEAHAWRILAETGVGGRVDPQKVRRCIEEKKGAPMLISMDS